MNTKQVGDLTRLDRFVQQGQTMHITRINRDWQTGVAHLVLGWEQGGDDLRKTMHMDETVTVEADNQQ
jgi:hypothetical protein